MSEIDRCTDCSFAFENCHHSCAGHQYCAPECPRCGGELRTLSDEEASSLDLRAILGD